MFVNDINDFSKLIMGKSQDQPLLHSLASLSENFPKCKNLFPENPYLSFPKLSLFSASQHFNLNAEYLARATVFNATFVNKGEAWIEIKQILLKHFLPDSYQKISMVKQQSQTLKSVLISKKLAFD